MENLEFTTIEPSTQKEIEKFIDDVIWDIGRREFCQDTQKVSTDLEDVENKQAEINGIFHEIDDLLDNYRQNLDKQKLELEQMELAFKNTEEEDSIYTYSYDNSSINKSTVDDEEKVQRVKEDDSIYTYHYGDSNQASSNGKASAAVAMETDTITASSAEADVIPMETESMTYTQPQQLPQPGPQPDPLSPISKPALAPGMKLLGKKRGDGIWYEGTFLGAIKESSGQEKYKIKYDGNKGKSLLSGKSIAYATNAKPWEVKVGSRIVGIYLNEADSHDECFYAGIVAETPMRMNNYRYLIFFDDGFAQYMSINKIYCVYQQSNNVWEDIHPDSREFIKQYLEIYPDRPMVKVKANQWIRTEWNGQWWKAKVVEVDGSLVNMLFEVDKRTEWIYRGSPRLETLYTELQHAEAARSSEKGAAQIRSRSTTCKSKGPYVEYTRADEEEIPARYLKSLIQTIPTPKVSVPPAKPTILPPPVPQLQESLTKTPKPVARKSVTAPPGGKQVAKKSTAQWRPQYYTQTTTPTTFTSTWEAPWLKRGQRNLGRSRGNLQQPKMDIASVLQSRLQQDYSDDSNDAYDFNTVRAIEQMRRDRRKRFVQHICTPICAKNCYRDPTELLGENPYLKPELCGWKRILGKQRGSGRRTVSYRTPCGRSLRSLPEIDRYLLETNITYLTIDLFTFDPFVHSHTNIRHPKPIMLIKDISEGKEPIPVSCVNEIDDRCPIFVEYTTQRICARGVSVNTDPQFLAGCNCTDNCRDRSKCSCLQLTIQATGSSNKAGIVDPEAGYEYRLLYDQILTGIYECNENCGCDHTCHNRVAQNGLQNRLQVFKTEKRGWGLRCLDDIPVGSFVCTYAGELLTEELANEDGKRFGDEYLAELDLIEVAENRKEGYESDVRDPDNNSNSTSGLSDSVDSSEDESSRRPFSSSSSESGSISIITSSTQTNRSTESDSEDDKGRRSKLRSSRRKVGPLLLRRQSSEKQKGRNTEEWTIERRHKRNKGDIAWNPGKTDKNHSDSSCKSSSSRKAPERLIIPEDDSVYVFPSSRTSTPAGDSVETKQKDLKNRESDKSDSEGRVGVVAKMGKGEEKPHGETNHTKVEKPHGETNHTKEASLKSEKDAQGLATQGNELGEKSSGKGGQIHGTGKESSGGEIGDLQGSVFVHEKREWVTKQDDTSQDGKRPNSTEPSQTDSVKIKQEHSSSVQAGTSTSSSTVQRQPSNQKQQPERTPGDKTNEKAIIDLTLDDDDADDNDIAAADLIRQQKQTPPPSINYGYNTNVTKSVVDKETLEYVKARRMKRRLMRQSRSDNDSDQTATVKTSEDKPKKKETKTEKSPEIDIITVPDAGQTSFGLQITGTTSLAVDSDVQTSDSENEASSRGAKTKGALQSLENDDDAGADAEESADKIPSTRLFFGEEHCYVMDAKSIGNLGRYLNHSCTPNLFVQNVFVDTHDLRFPWVAFFAQQFIRAGSELTWDYNYEVGSVPNKILHCYCGSTDCRGRLL